MNAVVLAAVPDLGRDPEVKLVLPERDVAEPELSIVIPALNARLIA